MSYVVAGIDPGLVDNGLVVVNFHETIPLIEVQSVAVASQVDANGDIEPTNTAVYVKSWIDDMGYTPDAVFIEAYRERGNNLKQDAQMRRLLQAYRTEFPDAKIIDNTGVKKVVRAPLLRLLGLTNFQTTHHQDLEAAARILVYGMLKHTELNALIADVVRDAVAGSAWEVQRL